MAEIIYSTDEKVIPGETTGNYFIAFTEDRIKKATIHQVTLTPDGDKAMTGKIKIAYRSVVNKTGDGIEYVSDGYGSTLIVDLADGVQTIVFEAAISAFVVAVEVGTSAVDLRVGAAGW